MSDSGFVPHVDDAQAVPLDLYQDLVEMVADQGEDTVDSEIQQCRGE